MTIPRFEVSREFGKSLDGQVDWRGAAVIGRLEFGCSDWNSHREIISQSGLQSGKIKRSLNVSSVKEYCA
jgi:hypothetical protein